MRFNICSSCVFFKPEIKDATQITRKHCCHPKLTEVFGPKYGFPSGSDIYKCDLHKPAGSDRADVVYFLPGGYQVCAIIPSMRLKSRLGAGDLYDNSKNQRVLKLFNEI